METIFSNIYYQNYHLILVITVPLYHRHTMRLQHTIYIEPNVILCLSVYPVHPPRPRHKATPWHMDMSKSTGPRWQPRSCRKLSTSDANIHMRLRGKTKGYSHEYYPEYTPTCPTFTEFTYPTYPFPPYMKHFPETLAKSRALENMFVTTECGCLILGECNN